MSKIKTVRQITHKNYWGAGKTEFFLAEDVHKLIREMRREKRELKGYLEDIASGDLTLEQCRAKAKIYLLKDKLRKELENE